MTYCRERPDHAVLRLQKQVSEATSSTGFEIEPSPWCDEIAQSNEGVMARLSQGPVRDADALNLEKSLFSLAVQAKNPRAAMRDILKGVKR